MVNHPDRTVWFSTDWLLGIVLFIPLWGVAGFGWGLVMAFFMGGSLLGWLFLGLLWGAFMWFFFAIYLLIAYRQLSTNIPLQEAATLPECLAKAVKTLWYRVEQHSPTSFICKPKFGLLRFLAVSELHVRLREGSVDLIGPAIAVNKVRKKLLAGSPRTASRTASQR